MTRINFRNICGVSVNYHIFFKFYYQKDNLYKYTDNTGISTIPMHLNDNEIG